MSTPFDALPGPVRQALSSGNALEAIKLLRQHRGISLKAAKERIDAATAHVPPHAPRQAARPHSDNGTLPMVADPPLIAAPGLAPGEVPGHSEWRWWVVAAVVVAVLVYAWRGYRALRG